MKGVTYHEIFLTNSSYSIDSFVNLKKNIYISINDTLINVACKFIVETIEKVQCDLVQCFHIKDTNIDSLSLGDHS